MNDGDIFLRALAENEDDTPTRLVYADWLDDHGQHEEADRQRKWPAAKEWLVRFCQENNPSPDDEDEYEYPIRYAELIELGKEAVQRNDEEDEDDEWFGFSCGNNMTMSEALNDNRREFWKNWSIVTGILLPPDIEEKSSFGCAC